jgi:4-diphosphocytidyl-2-C-methyl-D-erythritol kinase
MNNGQQTTCAQQFESVGNGLLVRAPAKINLSLLVAGKRPDGFHEIETIMAKVTWYDEVLIEPNPKAGLELICKGPQWSPAGAQNLVYQAAELLMKTCGQRANIKITLTKNIPAGTGLGSASSDAAATLIGLNKYFNLRLAPSRLADLAAQLGSDVAFFLDGPLALCSGKGEKIKKLFQNFNFLALLILADVTISTETVYANYRHDPALYQRLRRRINGYIKKNRIDLASKMCANMLQTSCFSLLKEIAELEAKVESSGIGPVCLSGSGTVMFRLLPDCDRQTATAYSRKLKKNVGCKSIIVSNNRW